MMMMIIVDKYNVKQHYIVVLTTVNKIIVIPKHT
jgi:hypothetical protein